MAVYTKTTMKKTDIEKNKALKLMGDLKATRTPGRFGQVAGALPDRREQRKLDQAAGLVPFPVKLTQPLIDDLRAHAEKTDVSVNELINTLLTDALKS